MDKVIQVTHEGIDMYQFSKFTHKSVIVTLCVFILLGCESPVDDPLVEDINPLIKELPPPAVPTLDGFNTVSEVLWDETAVRKVLNTFAYGGHATDAQITKWADMSPDLAITQMLTFQQHNLLLSPISISDDPLASKNGTLTELARLWSYDSPDNKTKSTSRFDIFGEFGQVRWLWTQATITRGLNPFRQKIGFWETNYHLATNRTVVPRRVMTAYYDAIMAAHAADLPYQKVLAVAAKSAAVAIQYGHRNNIFVDGICLCNEDFAREYHQLFFGILGTNDPDYHETTSIKNTAAALTHMRVVPDVLGGLSEVVVYGTERHTPGALEILHASIGGNNAEQRIDLLSDFAIEHPESLKNLPIKIISGLADDNMTDDKAALIQMAWQSMDEKKLLDFLRSYAISTLFHDSSRIKYATSIDRHTLIANRMTLNNSESYQYIYNPIANYEKENVRAFFPSHNVFGNQTGEEAISSATTFKSNFRNVTEDAVKHTQTTSSVDPIWRKDWGKVIPRIDGEYLVAEVTEWLWQYFIADGLKNLGELERAHLYALLSTGTDLAYLVNPDEKNRIITTTDIQIDPDINLKISNLAQQTLVLNSQDKTERLLSNHRIGLAVNFIVGTPYLFIEVGR